MKQSIPGFLICVEGIDGSGKSSFARSLSHELLRQQYHTLLTREPGGTALGERVRDILFDQKTPPCPQAEFLLFAASRAQHCQQLIKPALEKGCIVISDRMADSSLVYQGYMRGLSPTFIKQVNAWALDTVVPRIVFYLEVSAQHAADRIHKRNVPGAPFEESVSHLQQALDGFKDALSGRPEVIILDANQSADVVFQEGLHALQQFLPELIVS